MNIFDFTTILFLGSLAAGFLGALTGLGGGVIIVPFLVLLLHVNIDYAIGAALVSVIATSCGAAAAYVREGYTNTRIGMFLEIATTIGAICGAALANVLPNHVISIIFGVVLLYSAWLARVKHGLHEPPDHADPIAEKLRLDSTYPSPDGPVAYHVHGVPAGFGIMWIAGVLSGLLGIGSGAVKVLAMDRAMKLPFKVSTTTSNFMIGVTAAASAGVYLNRGYIDPGLAMPVMIGVLLGSLVGARVLTVVKVDLLRLVFQVVIVLLGLQMIYHGWSGGL